MSPGAALCFATDGVEIRRRLFLSAQLENIKRDISLDSDIFRHCGVRNLEKRFASIAALVKDELLLAVATECLRAPVHLVRALFFDKTPQRNWFVTWHQDKTVAVNKRFEMIGWDRWSIKDGVQHVQPPVAVLNSMLTLRLHLDAADETNGCLRVIPGSHVQGLLGEAALAATVAGEQAIDCCLQAGDALLMRPHILHASGKSHVPGHRRVIHLEYSCFELPAGIAWA